MKKVSGAQKTRFTFFGYLLFFVLISFVATCSILVYSMIYEKSGGNKTTTAILTLVVLLVLTFACTVIDTIRRKYTVEKPVQKIVSATESIANGDFEVRLVPAHSFGKYDEFDVIAENINRMASELSKTELFRTDFIANVSHEIKTPLAVIQNYAVGLQSESLSIRTRVEYSQTLLSASKRLSDLITNILNLSKLESQEIFPKKSTFDLGEQLRECVLNFEEKIDDKNISLDCDIDDINIISDSGILEIVWNNILSNALKFTGVGGKICVTLKSKGEYALITVSDTGCGISKEIGERIFDKFYQGDSSHSLEGNGLGLALVKRVIDIIGGEITVNSETGKGSTFSIKIRKDEK